MTDLEIILEFWN